MLVDGGSEEEVAFTILHRSSGQRRDLRRTRSFFKRHALSPGDVLHFVPLGPGKLGVTVHKAGSQVGPWGWG